MTEPGPRQLAGAFNRYHNLVYYCPEHELFRERGMKSWWMGYFAYRAAPLGRVPAEVVTATFYGFAPRMVARALPEGWDILPPAEALALRDEVADRALRRVLGDAVGSPEVAEAAALGRRAVEGCDVVGRPLYAGHTTLRWPEQPHLALYHACTLLREHRGDGHVVALAAHELDGVACHVVVAGAGHGNQESILPIRGWTSEEWDAAAAGLVERGWLGRDGRLTEAGRAGRAAVEALTDELASEPCRRLGRDGLARFLELMAPITELLAARGGVPGTWPPPHLLRPPAG